MLTKDEIIAAVDRYRIRGHKERQRAGTARYVVYTEDGIVSEPMDHRAAVQRRNEMIAEELLARQSLRGPSSPDR